MLEDKKRFICYWHGTSMLLLNNLQSDMHQHYAAQIYIGIDDKFKICIGNSLVECRTIVIDSNQPHRVQSGDGYIMLIHLNPNIYNINKNIFNHNYYIPGFDVTDKVIKKLDKIIYDSCEAHDAKILVSDILSSILPDKSITKNIDPRITKLLNILDDFNGDKISSKLLAQKVGLSESHLAHLFKQNTGTTVRRYLSWLRLCKAIKLIMKGNSFTTSAHESGFSDSAHLSSTYRQMFGVTPSQILRSSIDK